MRWMNSNRATRFIIWCSRVHGQCRVKYSSANTRANIQAVIRDAGPSPKTQGRSSHPDLDASPSLSVSDTSPDALKEARKMLLAQGYDPTSFWEQPIVWGDHDSFQHVNNVRYVRFFESGRITWMTSLGNQLGGPSKAQDMLKARGISLILKSITVNFKRPVTYPDTLVIAHRPYLTSSTPNSRTEFNLAATAYSLSQRAIVATSDAALVWYDYDQLKKCDPGKDVWAVLGSRITG